MVWRRQLLLPGLILYSVLTACPAVAQQAAFKVLYAERPNLNTTLKVMLDFGAGVRRPFVVDTGSVGIVVPSSDLPKGVGNAQSGSIEYSSSGLVVEGFWTVPIDVALDVSGAIAHVPVFAATSAHCILPASNVCNAKVLPHIMGIGFGRPESYATPDRNPLIHISNLPLGRPSNYLITSTGIELGISTPLGIAGIHTTSLVRYTRQGLMNQPVTDFKTPTGTIQMNGGAPETTAVLIDTGITDALIALTSGEPSGCVPLPPAAGANCVIPAGTGFSLSQLGGVAKWSFTMGDGGAATPASGHWIHLDPQQGSFVNTGIRPLADFDVFFDATGGAFGLVSRTAVVLRTDGRTRLPSDVDALSHPLRASDLDHHEVGDVGSGDTAAVRRQGVGVGAEEAASR